LIVEQLLLEFFSQNQHVVQGCLHYFLLFVNIQDLAQFLGYQIVKPFIEENLKSYKFNELLAKQTKIAESEMCAVPVHFFQRKHQNQLSLRFYLVVRPYVLFDLNVLPQRINLFLPEIYLGLVQS
jgi:hypothetical protein